MIEDVEKILDVDEERIYPNDNKEAVSNDFIKFLKILICIFFVTAIIFGAIGFNKFYVYENGTYTSTNVYVGGDAYNYIINANRAIAYFVLALIFIVLALTCLIVLYQHRIHMKITKKP